MDRKTWLKMVATSIAITIALVAFGPGQPLELEAAVRSGRFTVTTTATAFYTAPPRGATVLLCNRHTASVFLGGDATLTTANGFELAAGDCTAQTPYRGDAIWMIVGAATARVDWIEGSYPR